MKYIYIYITRSGTGLPFELFSKVELFRLQASLVTSLQSSVLPALRIRDQVYSLEGGGEGRGEKKEKNLNSF